MKAFRRTKSDKKQPIQVSAPIREGPSEKAKSMAPKKVIRATQSYTAQHPGELSFNKDDYFYVVTENDDTSKWFECTNPTTNMKGFVPRSLFEVLYDKAERHPEQAGLSASASASASGSASSSAAKKNDFLLAVVNEDFIPDNKDEDSEELHVVKGETLSIVAHYNYEWVLAKLISRVGGPGLVSSYYLTIQDPTTGKAISDLKEGFDKARIPTIDEWRMQNRKYQSSSIPVLNLEVKEREKRMQRASAHSVGSKQQQRSQSRQLSVSSSGSGRNLRQTSGTLGTASTEFYPVAAAVREVYFDDGFWYLVTCEMSSNTFRNLCRRYHDFYNLHLRLKDEFPVEGGDAGSPRTLPMLPGPREHVNDRIASDRKFELNEYIAKLIKLPVNVSRSQTVLQFFQLRDTDVQTVGGYPERLPDPKGGSAARHSSHRLSHQRGSRQLHQAAARAAGASMSRSASSSSVVNSMNTNSVGPSDGSSNTRSSYGPKQPSPNNSTQSNDIEDYYMDDESDKVPEMPTRTPSKSSYSGVENRHNSQKSSVSISSASNISSSIRIKFCSNADEMFAISVPKSIPLADLVDKITEKLVRNDEFKGIDSQWIEDGKSRAQLRFLQNNGDILKITTNEELFGLLSVREKIFLMVGRV